MNIKTIKLYNIALVSKYDSNLILLGKFQESYIKYHNNLGIVTLMKSEKMIAQAKKNHNLCILDLTIPNLVMSTISKIMLVTG